MSFILDALRKSEHERQQSATPGLSPVPLSTPPAQLPRWALVVIGGLAAAVLVLGGAWWQSSRLPTEPTASIPALTERTIELPPAAALQPSTGPQQAAPTRALSPPADAGEGASSLAAAATTNAGAAQPRLTEPSRDAPVLSSGRLDLPADAAALPSAGALAAEGVALPPLRLELHAFSGQPAERFVFINGRKYVEGERLPEGPEVVSITPRGAVLAHAGRRFVLIQE